MYRLLRRPPGLTSRGLSFIVAGGLLLVVGILGAIPPAAMFGALVCLLPLVLVLLTRAEDADLRLARTLSVRELPVGGTIGVTLTVRGRLARGRSLLIEDVGAATLGGSHRVALRGLGGRAISAAHYRVRAAGRGVHAFGPVRLHTVDSFGLVHRVRVIDLHDTVLVHPVVVPVEPLVLGGAAMATGVGQAGAPGAASDDLVPRAYRPGDEVRRLDWKATARTGELMVRSEESLRRSALTLLLDLCDRHHFGREPRSSVDALLEIAASVGVMALTEGWEVDVRTTQDVVLFTGSPAAGASAQRRELLLALATAPLADEPVPAATLRHSVATTGPVLLLTGAAGTIWARLLAPIGTHSTRRMALVVAAEQWAPTPAGAWWHGEREAADLTAQELADLLSSAGWRVARRERDGSTGTAWAELGSPS